MRQVFSWDMLRGAWYWWDKQWNIHSSASCLKGSVSSPSRQSCVTPIGYLMSSISRLYTPQMPPKQQEDSWIVHVGYIFSSRMSLGILRRTRWFKKNLQMSQKTRGRLQLNVFKKTTPDIHCVRERVPYSLSHRSLFNYSILRGKSL